MSPSKNARFTLIPIFVPVLFSVVGSCTLAQATGRWKLPSTVPQFFGYCNGPGYHAPRIIMPGHYPPKPTRFTRLPDPEAGDSSCHQSQSGVSLNPPGTDVPKNRLPENRPDLARAPSRTSRSRHALSNHRSNHHIPRPSPPLDSSQSLVNSGSSDPVQRSTPNHTDSAPQLAVLPPDSPLTHALPANSSALGMSESEFPLRPSPLPHVNVEEDLPIPFEEVGEEQIANRSPEIKSIEEPQIDRSDLTEIESESWQPPMRLPPVVEQTEAPITPIFAPPESELLDFSTGDPLEQKKSASPNQLTEESLFTAPPLLGGGDPLG